MSSVVAEFTRAILKLFTLSRLNAAEATPEDIELQRSQALHLVDGLFKTNQLVYLVVSATKREWIKSTRFYHAVIPRLRKGPEMVLAVGTGLKVPVARILVKEFCRSAKSGGELVVQISKDPVPFDLLLGLYL